MWIRSTGASGYPSLLCILALPGLWAATLRDAELVWHHADLGGPIFFGAALGIVAALTRGMASSTYGTFAHELGHALIAIVLFGIFRPSA
jgi:hypothetical protein